MENKFWVNGALQEWDFSPLTSEDYAVIDCLVSINPENAYGDVKTDCEYELRRVYQRGKTDAQPKPATDGQIDKLLDGINEKACDIDYTIYGLPLNGKDMAVRESFRKIVRNWLNTLNQPPAPSSD